MSKYYSFTTHWQTKAQLIDAWNAIYDSEAWPQWWKGIEVVKERLPGDKNGIGSIREYTVRSPSGYKLHFKLLLTERDDHKTLGGIASGDLEGTGTWKFYEHNGMTHIECHWNVYTTIPWMNTLAFLLKPAFKLNHKLVMRNGAKSLAKRLGIEVIDK